jgi:DNA-binding transcriptional LysR family regulator
MDAHRPAGVPRGGAPRQLLESRPPASARTVIGVAADQPARGQPGGGLFTRTTRNLTLTGAGELLATRAQHILTELEEARDAVRDFDAAPRGILRVTAPVAFGRVHVAPAILAFLERYPEISVEFGHTDRVVDLVEEGVDVAIRIGKLPDSSLVARRGRHGRSRHADHRG